VADLFAGQNAVISILVALQARTFTGEGQYIDIALFDSELGWLANVASNFLISGNNPKRYGNTHANIVPYQSFQASDGWFVVAVGNDKQFESFCRVIDRQELTIDERFSTNSARVQNREILIPLLTPIFMEKTVGDWLSLIGDQFPCGPINNFEQVFSMPHVKEREMLVEMQHPTIGALPLVGSPLKMGSTPVSYRLPPPLIGEHTEEILTKVLGLSSEKVTQLRESGCIK
jgi:crotonobetainyl-CoA:carnitine CoA-transferase CaiB-like acyl-CoA transferase